MIKGLLIGRFQPFHKGHADAVDFALKNCDKLTIAVGSPKEYGKENNPFSFSERKKMIELSLKKNELEKIAIKELKDTNNAKTWRASVEKFKADIIFTNNPSVEEVLKGISLKHIPVKINCNGSEIRRKMYLGQRWKECVSPKAAQYLAEIKAPEKIKKLVK